VTKTTIDEKSKIAPTTDAPQSPSAPPQRRKKESKRRSRRSATVARPDSKKAAVIAMMRRPKGATVAEIMKTTGWQAHSVRGLISGSLRKAMGLAVKSDKRADGQRAYQLKK
jgi:hypothetical protein